MSGCLSGIDVVVLAGGLGTRLAGVLGDTPKVLAPIGERPYLQIPLAWPQGFGRTPVVLGLGPLRLEEKLSNAATGHSQDMKALGFFSHTSPVPGKASFGDRARKAGFRGSPRGECIAAGYGSASAAYRGWFYSDGHRHIMLARGPSVLGIGPVGSHWTLMTGR